MGTIDNADSADRLGIVVVDDDERDRKDVEACFQYCGSVEFHACESPDTLNSIPETSRVALCILDIRFSDERVRITELIDRVEERWPDAVLVILTDHRGEVSERDAARVDAVLDKVEFAVMPQTLTITIRDAVRRKKVSGRWPFGNVGTFIDVRDRILLHETSGYIREINEPHVEVVIEDSHQKARKYRTLLMPSDIFAAVGILGQDMRFTYRVYRQENRIYSEVLPPTDDITWHEDMPPHLRAIEDIEDAKRREPHGEEIDE